MGLYQTNNTSLSHIKLKCGPLTKTLSNVVTAEHQGGGLFVAYSIFKPLKL